MSSKVQKARVATSSCSNGNPDNQLTSLKRRRLIAGWLVVESCRVVSSQATRSLLTNIVYHTTRWLFWNKLTVWTLSGRWIAQGSMRQTTNNTWKQIAHWHRVVWRPILHVGSDPGFRLLLTLLFALVLGSWNIEASTKPFRSSSNWLFQPTAQVTRAHANARGKTRTTMRLRPSFSTIHALNCTCAFQCKKITAKI